MRKIEYFTRKYIANSYPAKYTIEDIGTGLFLGWGVDCAELDGGVGSYTVALIQLDNGFVIEKSTTCIRFLPSDEAT